MKYGKRLIDFAAILFFAMLFAPRSHAQTVNLGWRASPSPGSTYNVYRSERNSGTVDSFAQIEVGQSGTTYADSTVAYGHVYAYYITAVDGGAEGLESNVILVNVVSPNDPRPAASGNSGKTRDKR